MEKHGREWLNKCPGRFMTTSPDESTRDRTPMGQIQHTPAVKSASRRFPSRTCLRKGCGQVFQPVRWNQRYCREPSLPPRSASLASGQTSTSRIVSRPRTENATPKQKLGADARRRRLPTRPKVPPTLHPRKPCRDRLRSRLEAARGHAATRFLKIFATVRDAMNRCRQTLEHRLGIAVVIVARRCDAFVTVNVSG